MRIAKRTTSHEASAGPRPVTSDRRERRRLSDLCDEVLASYRVAHDRDPISAQDRADAHRFLSGLTPTALG